MCVKFSFKKCKVGVKLLILLIYKSFTPALNSSKAVFSCCVETWRYHHISIQLAVTQSPDAFRPIKGENVSSSIKAQANEDTLLRTHCCRHKCFPAYPRAQHLLRTHNFVSGTQKNVSDFVQKHFVSPRNVSQFAQPKKHHGQQCLRNKVS